MPFRHILPSLSVALLFAATSIRAQVLPPPATHTIDFVKEVQPILEQSCYSCHGQKLQKGDLRWDVKQLALHGGEHGAEFIPGNSAESRIIQLVAGVNPDEVMPKKGDRLTSTQIGILRAWIDQGAHWPDGVDKVKYTDPKDHWAFKAPVKPKTPNVKTKGFVRNPIDTFILAQLEKEKLKPSPEADKATLIRRLSLDLIGLPPTIKEVDDFLADKSPDAYNKLVDRLLASPHYGERWGRHWLDAARYADTNGYEKDLPRNIWPYRDWVIDAFNKDLPFDEFTIDQIAGDLVPNATTETRVATGFFRNSMLNEEGGIDPEQFRIEGIIDRIDALGKSFLGLTVACAQCHNHKFDPISQKEYYQLFAFLNSDDEPELEIAPTGAQKAQRVEIQKIIAKIDNDLMKTNATVSTQMAAWEKEMRDLPREWVVLDPESFYGGVGTKFSKLKDKSLLATGSSPPISVYTVNVKTKLKGITGFRLEAITDPNLPTYGPGRAPNGNFVLTEFAVTASPENDLTKTNQVSLQNASADFSQTGFPIEATIDQNAGISPKKKSLKGDKLPGWANDGGPGRRNMDRNAVFETETPVGFDEGTALLFTLSQTFGTQHTIGRFRISATTGAQPLQADPLSPHLRDILAITPANRTPQQQMELFSAFRAANTNAAFAEANKKIDAEMDKWPSGPKTLVLLQRSELRETHLFKRGDFKKPGDQVFPNTPAVLQPMPQTGATNRLTLAKWIADKKNPLTARVFVNRMWQEYFGQGLVTTPEDFGTRCDGASHPELLDWLATEFMDQNWSMKAMHRLIVQSATYRQSSKVSPELYAVDQYNRWMARGARFRVDAEIVRDNALKISGLLNPKLGGPSVYPPIPDGVLSLAYGSSKWEAAKDEERYRRGMYTFWKRTVTYPSLSVFDAPNADSSCVRRMKSNTPLQALTTLNDTLFYECAQAMAMRVWKEGGDSDKSRAQFAFRLCTGRFPDETELKDILALLTEQETYFEKRTDKAIKVALADPLKIPEEVNLHQVAAWTTVSRVLLNMDETFTKE